MKRLLLILLLLALMPLSRLWAQALIVVTPVSGLSLPWGLSNLSVVDGHLFAYQNGVLVSAVTSGSVVTSLSPDTVLTPLCPGANYVVRNGADSLLYFTTLNESEPSSFNVHTNARFFKNRQVELKSWFREVTHPIFTADGTTVIFSAKGKVGLGGNDLWCSFWNGKRWSKPVNMGNIINTPGDEICPVFYGNYLLFASNGVPGALPGFHLYAVRFPSGSKADDVIFANYVVQPLPQPLNSAGDDTELAFDPATGRGYWLSTRHGLQQLFTFTGRLDGVMLSGTVTDSRGNPVPQADVRLFASGRLVAEVATDSAGSYSLFAHPADGYTLQVSKPDFFRYVKSVSLYRSNEELLIASQTHNVTLARLPFGRVMVFDNIFRESGDIELTPQSEEALQPIVDYLRDNPNVVAEFTLYSSQVADQMYANLVIERRISNLQHYMKSCLPSGVRILYKNGVENGQKSPLGEVGDAVFIELFGD